jgi:hypothetical protein
MYHTEEKSTMSFVFIVLKSYIICVSFSDIWNKFLEFESNIGDLGSIVKTEKRRSEVLNQVCGFTLISRLFYERSSLKCAVSHMNENIGFYSS